MKLCLVVVFRSGLLFFSSEFMAFLCVVFVLIFLAIKFLLFAGFCFCLFLCWCFVGFPRLHFSFFSLPIWVLFCADFFILYLILILFLEDRVLFAYYSLAFVLM